MELTSDIYGKSGIAGRGTDHTCNLKKLPISNLENESELKAKS